MAPPNATWRDLLAQASQNPEVLRHGDTIRNVHTILSTNVSVCSSLGHPFIHQMERLYMDMLQVYRSAAPCSGCAARPVLHSHKLPAEQLTCQGS